MDGGHDRKSGVDAAQPPTGDPRGDSYHHGDLRHALIEAAHQLIHEQGADAFRVIDASRAVGVSSAAPYRHFSNRKELIGEVSALGFRALTKELRAARDAHPEGSIEALVALGQAYVNFVSADPEMFHLMWGTTRERFDSDAARIDGCACFDVLLEAVGALLRRQGLGHLPVRAIALPHWSGVHGLASLKLGQRLKVVDGVDIAATVEFATRTFVAGVETFYGRDADASASAPLNPDHRAGEAGTRR